MESLYTLREVSKILNIRYDRAAELARQKILPTVLLGRSIRVCPQQLQAFIDSGGKPLQNVEAKQAA